MAGWSTIPNMDNRGPALNQKRVSLTKRLPEETPISASSMVVPCVQGTRHPLVSPIQLIPFIRGALHAMRDGLVREVEMFLTS